MPDYHQMSKADRRELLRKLKRDLDDESMLSALGIKGDRNFDDDSDAPPSSTSDGWYYSYDDRSVFSDDGSTALYTEASTAFDTEASTAPLFSSTSSSRRDGKLARKDDGAIVYEYEPKVQRGCDLTDACMSLIMGDCNIEVEEVRTGFEHSDDMSVSMILGKYNGANKSDNDRRGRPIVDVREVRDVLVDDIRTGGGSRGGRSSKQGLLVKDRLSSRRGENMSDDGLRTDVVPFDTSAIPVEGVCDDGDGKSMNDEVLVDDRSGDFFLIQGGCKVEIDDDMNQNDQQLVRSNDIIWLKVDDDIEEEIIVDSVGSDGLEGSPLSNSGGNSSNDEVKVGEGTERDNVRSNETSHHDNEEEMGDKVLPDDLGSSGSKGCHRSKSEGVRADEIISGMSSCFGDCELEVGEEYEHSIQGTRSDERSRHAGDEEMGEEILAEYVIRDGSEPSPTSTKESTFKRLFSSKRISKKSDERDSTPDPELTTRKGVTLKERMALFGRSAQKSNDTDPTNVDANLSPAFVTATGTSSLKDSLLAVIPAQQVKEDSALTHVCPTVEKDYPCSPCDGVWDLKHEIIELSSYSVVQDDDVSYAITGADDINRLTSGIIIRSDVNATKQETSSTKQASFFARVGKTSQKSKATASTVKAKSSSRIKSTKTHKSTCESGVSGVTPKKKKLREYFDASSGRPYFSNVINATWGKPSNVDSPQRSSRTPIVSNTREFTIPVSTQPSMQEQLSQPKAREESPESKEKEQTTQSKNLKNVSLILKKKKAFSIDYPKETKSATCRSDGTVSTTDEVPAMSIREYPDHTQLQEKAMVLDDNISVSVSTFLIADDSTVDAIETAKSPAATTTTAKEEEREKTTTTTAKEEGEETMATKTRRWREYTDPSSGVKYYSDGVTSTWEKPTTFVPSNPSPTHPKKTVIF
jgi:hypothetical protein